MAQKTHLKIKKNQHVLVVEDNEFRCNWFLERIPGCMIATSPADALSILNTFEVEDLPAKFDIVFLDHDCAATNFVDPTDPDFLRKSFWTVAQYLRDIDFGGTVIIHSGNPVGANRMRALLGPLDHRPSSSSSIGKVHVIPFGSFDVEVV